MLLVLAAACAGLCALYFHQSLTAPFNSDGAANVLQGQAIIHGNPLLRGWWTSDVSFYTTELPEYALVTAIHDHVVRHESPPSCMAGSLA